MKRLLPLLLLLFSFPVLAESGYYRVEVIVFRNLLSTVVPEDTLELRNFSEFPDPGNDDPAKPVAVDTPDDPAMVLTDDFRGYLPDDMIAVSQKSEQMNNAWRRLRSSQNYRPLVYTAWDQSRIDYNPPIRVHNEQVIDIQLRPPTPVMVADLTADDPLAAYRSTFFQVDGSVQLRRSRFLHLFLDLELRERQAESVINTDTTGGIDFQANTPATILDETPNDAAGVTNEPGAYGVYSLRQNRQINTGKMQYFDTPYFGALVYVSSITVQNQPN